MTEKGHKFLEKRKKHEEKETKTRVRKTHNLSISFSKNERIPF
jgi:hypothetical protein